MFIPLWCLVPALIPLILGLILMLGWTLVLLGKLIEEADNARRYKKN